MNDKLKLIKSWLGLGSINIFGLPFSGKDTHGLRLAKDLNAHFVSGGDLIRKHNKLHEKSKKIVDQGALAPTADYLEMMLPELSKPLYVDSPLVLGSVGRWDGEEQAIIKVCKQANHPIKAVIYLRITAKEMHKRFEHSLTTGDRGKRNDDKLHKLEKRQYEFETKTLPVIETYRQLGLLIEVDGIRPKEEVYASLIDGIYSQMAT